MHCPTHIVVALLVHLPPTALPPVFTSYCPQHMLPRFNRGRLLVTSHMGPHWVLAVYRCAQLLRQHALSPLAVPAGLGPTVRCCMLALLYCTALETSHSLMLSPRLMRDLWPTCDQVHTHPSMRTFNSALLCLSVDNSSCYITSMWQVWTPVIWT